MPAYELSGEALRDARDWLMDCTWADVDTEDIAAMPASVITSAVRRHYDGGIAAFLAA
jgi:hypothetical protein